MLTQAQDQVIRWYQSHMCAPRSVSQCIQHLSAAYLQMIQLRREGEVRWRSERREIKDVELKEVIGSIVPVGGKAVNKSLLIGGVYA